MANATRNQSTMRSVKSPASGPLRLVASAFGVLLIGAAMGGCYEPVFREDEARSQYDRFDAVREQRAPQYYFDEYGNRKPNIRGRLLGNDT